MLLENAGEVSTYDIMKTPLLTPPRWLSRQAKHYWSELSPQVANWTPQVRQQLALLCDWYSIYRDADKDVGIKYKACCQIQRLSKMIGLSDSTAVEGKDDLDQFFTEDDT